MSYIILDLDNCISDDGWRIDRIRWDKSYQQRYHEYHMLSGFDKYRNSHLVCGYDVVISTSRPQFYEQITRRWLFVYGIKPVMLLMRKDGDYRPTVQVKLEHHQATKDALPNDLHCIYDDNPAVIAMYKSLGINARQIYITNPTNFKWD